MKIVPLYKVCAIELAWFIKVGDNPPFSVVTEEYQDKKEWFVKGEYTVQEYRGEQMIVCARLEKDITISINRPLVNGEKILEDLTNEVRSFVFYHVPTGMYAGKDLKRKDLPAYIDASLESFEVKMNETPNKKDFVVAIINWEAKNIIFEKIN